MAETLNHSELTMYNENRRQMYSRSIMSQSIPSLLISLIGFTIAGIYLEDANKTPLFTIYPLILVATCILTFKGNIELIFALHLSSVSNIYNLVMEYAAFAIDNSCIVVIQSIFIGLCVGFIGISVIILRCDSPLLYAIITLCSCLVSCFVSTLVVLLILFVAITLFRNLQINPDNVILPSISAFSDYFTVLSLIFFFRLFHKMRSIKICLTTTCLILGVVPFIAQVSRRSASVLPMQSLKVAGVTFILSSIAGMLIEYFSAYFSVLPSAATVFCGLTGSTSFIYLNRRLTSLYTKQPHNKKASLFSLLIISLAMSLIYVIISNTMFIKLPHVFSALFIVCFVVDVYLLIELIDYILSRFQRRVELAGVIALPLITSTADFFGSFFLVLIVLLISFLNS